jgi:hypothetical protein
MPRSLLSFIILIAAGCGSDTVGPAAPNAEIGNWGGRGLALSATKDAVHAQFICDAVDFPGPIAPTSRGQFALPATASRSHPSVHMGASGTVADGVITLEVVNWYPGGSSVQKFTVVRGQAADLSGFCALQG